jgi:hypothetical protein
MPRRSGEYGKEVDELTLSELLSQYEHCARRIASLSPNNAKYLRKHQISIEKRLAREFPDVTLPQISETESAEQVENPRPLKRPNEKSRIMYIEYKGDGIAGTARIGRVTYSQTGKSLYYRKQAFQSLKGDYKANYFDVATGERYWISGCKKEGHDTLYPGMIEVDEDVREEYWLEIRNEPECVKLKSFRSEGKYSKRRPK